MEGRDLVFVYDPIGDCICHIPTQKPEGFRTQHTQSLMDRNTERCQTIDQIGKLRIVR